MTCPFSREEIHQKIYLLGMALLVCCLPLSRFMVSIAQFLLLLNWILEGNYQKKISVILRYPAIWLFASLFLLYAISCFYSQNSQLAMERMKNALPLLLFPIITSTSIKYNADRLKHILLLFSLAVIAAAITCLVNYFHPGSTTKSFREISIFMPHMRFTLLINMAITILLYYLFNSDVYIPLLNRRAEKILLLLSTVFLIGFLIFLRSLTGIFIMMVILPVFAVNRAFLFKKAAGYFALFMLLLTVFVIFLAIGYTWKSNFSPKPVNKALLEMYTQNGNPYIHDTADCGLENGQYKGLFICEDELKREWNSVSKISYENKDLKGQDISETLKRYLTSKGLHKDSLGVHLLTVDDLAKIEKGITNYKFSEEPNIQQRLYETLWEVKIYLCSGFVNRHTFGQRIAFIKAAFHIIKGNFFTGTGSGDVYGAMHKAVSEKGILVDPAWEGKPHNQFLFYMMAFGITGFLWIMICLVFPVIKSRAYHHTLFNLFSLIILISMLTLDTMESYDSMAFFASFYCLFNYGYKKTNDE